MVSVLQETRSTQLVFAHGNDQIAVSDKVPTSMQGSCQFRAAEPDDGVFTITLPKPAEAKAKRIEVKEKQSSLQLQTRP